MADLSKMRNLCDVLGLDFLQRIRAEVDRSVENVDAWMTSDLSIETAARLKDYVEILLEERLGRLSELKKRGLAIMSYWDVLCVPFEEKKEFSSLMYYIGVDSADDITESNALSVEFIKKVENEYHRLREQLNDVIMKKKSKLEQILKTAHLPSTPDKAAETSDPVTTLVDLKTQISEAKAAASNRASIVTKIQLLQHADEEIQWYNASEKDGISLNDARSTKARLLQKALPEMASKLEADLADWHAPFIFDGMDAMEILRSIQCVTGMKQVTKLEGTSAEKTVEKGKVGTSVAKSVEEGNAIGIEATDEEYMQVDSGLPMSLHFSQKAPRSHRRVARHLPQPSTPPDSTSDESMSSPSERSDDSMGGRTDPSDSDYDPKKDESMSSPSERSDDSIGGKTDPDDSDYDPKKKV